MSENKGYLTSGTLWLMTVGAGLVVANNYYNQPLLGMISSEFDVSEEATSKVAMLTQMGYAAGLLLLVPLGDLFKRKRIILIDFFFIIISLLVFAFSKSLELMIISSFFIGLTSVVPQIFVPMAAQLSHPERKGRNVGIVMSGLLVGILASRVFSGWVGDLLGWRSVFLLAAGMMLVLGVLLSRLLPNVQPTFSGTYSQLMSSIYGYTKSIPSLRLASIRGAFAFASFSVFWTTLTFRLEQAPFFAGSDIAGTMGLFGIAGALGASYVGHISGRMNKNQLVSIACALMIVSWIFFGVWGSSYVGLIMGVLLLDLGLQSMHVTNQTIVFSSHPEASNRLNTVYMVSYFVGGSLGTLVGGWAWGNYGWNGVVTVGFSFVLLCILIHFTLCGKQKYKI